MGSLFGWVLEVFFRRFFSRANPERRWINPGFLIGPYLPLYGFGLCTLYLLANAEQYLPIASAAWRKTVLLLAIAVSLTVIEYIAGVIFIHGMKVKLWDYTNQWGNIGGIICPKFSLYWAILGALYDFCVHPYILESLIWLSNNLAFSFFVGFFFGVFIIDFVYSSKLLLRIREFAQEYGVIVRFEDLKAHIRESKEQRREKARFLLATVTELPMVEYLHSYYQREKERGNLLLQKFRKKTEKRHD